jgi:hypothetical protein
MMKGTPCSSRDRALLKTLGKLSYSHRSGNPAKRVRARAQIGHRTDGLYTTSSRTKAKLLGCLSNSGMPPVRVSILVFHYPLRSSVAEFSLLLGCSKKSL